MDTKPLKLVMKSSSVKRSRVLLIVNPNSSVSMTENLERILPTPPECELSFFTGPPEAPREIDGAETAHQSARACFPGVQKLLGAVDGVLVCCYSDHPLIYMLRKETSKPVLGIFQASLSYATAQSPSRYGILTSTSSWEPLLDASVQDFFGGVTSPLFTGTVAANINVLKLNEPEYFDQLVQRAAIVVRDHDSQVVLLGCAGLSGLEKKLEARFADRNVRFIDSVKFGAEMLNTLVRFDTE